MSKQTKEITMNNNDKKERLVFERLLSGSERWFYTSFNLENQFCLENQFFAELMHEHMNYFGFIEALKQAGHEIVDQGIDFKGTPYIDVVPKQEKVITKKRVY